MASISMQEIGLYVMIFVRINKCGFVFGGKIVILTKPNWGAFGGKRLCKKTPTYNDERGTAK